MKGLRDLQSALEVFPSSLIHSQQSRPLDKQSRAGADAGKGCSREGGAMNSTRAGVAYKKGLLQIP